MAVTIRLSRTGRKKTPNYRVVVADQRRKRDGRIIEAIGHYDPHSKPFKITLKQERVTYWLDKGARPTVTVAHLLKRAARESKAEGATK